MKEKRKTRIKALKVKIKSLAYESKCIRLEERRMPGAARMRVELWQHRTIDVRNEQRLSLLAYAFLRGCTYGQCEQSCKVPLTPADWNRVISMIKRFGDIGNLDEQTVKMSMWIADATSRQAK